MVTLLSLGGPAAARADLASGGAALTGEVTAANSRWTDDGLRLYTTATIRTDDGRVEQLRVPGGSADGLAVVQFDGARPLPHLAVGQRVAVTRTRGTRDGTGALVVDELAVLRDVQGFVRTGPTRAGAYLRWASGCVMLTPSTAGTSSIAGDVEFDVISDSVDNWNQSIAGCSYMNLVLDPPSAGDVGKDLINRIVFRDERWCTPATELTPEECHNPAAGALTTVTFIDDGGPRDGVIVDADIEFNAVGFALGHDGQTEGTAPCLIELGNTLMHELGHLLGLEHTCVKPGEPARLDDQGAPVPDCFDDNGPAITEPTMYFDQDCGETKKISLEDDDIAAVCTVYPLADDPGVCEPATLDDGGGCCGAGGGGQGSAMLALGVALGMRRRRRRQMPGSPVSM